MEANKKLNLPKVQKSKSKKNPEAPVVSEQEFDKILNDYMLSLYDRKYNILTNQTEFYDKNINEWIANDRDGFIADMLLFCRRKFKNSFARLSKEELRLIIDSRLYRTEYNPIQHYFMQLNKTAEWGKTDTTDYIAIYRSLLEFSEEPDYFIDGKPCGDFFYDFIKRWLVQSIAIAFEEPNSGNGHVMLIIHGTTGDTGKTSMIQWLCPTLLYKGYYFEGNIIPKASDKDALNHLRSKFLICLDDQLKNIMDRPEDLETIKNLITATQVTFSQKHKPEVSTYTRVASFVATTNHRDIFHDEHNRRYMIFSVNEKSEKHGKYFYDKKRLKTFPYDKLWSQAFYLYKSGEHDWHYNAEEKRKINASNITAIRQTLEKELLLKHFELPCTENMYNCKWVQKVDMLATVCNLSGLRDKINKNIFFKEIDNAGFKTKSVSLTGNSADARYRILACELTPKEHFYQEEN